MTEADSSAPRAHTPSGRVSELRWRLIDEGLDRRLAVASRIAEAVQQMPRAHPDHPTLLTPGPLGGASPSLPPVSHHVHEATVVGLVEDAEAPMRLALSDGSLRFARPDAKGRRRTPSERTVARVEQTRQQARRPMRHRVRPSDDDAEGTWDRQPQATAAAYEGLDQFGVWKWQAVPGGAHVGMLDAAGANPDVLPLDPKGNTVLCGRLSSEDRKESLVAQVEPGASLVLAYPEDLRPRMVLMSENLSGTRPLRPERAGPPPPGVLERDDLLLLDGLISEGWVEHVVWRDADRIARHLEFGLTALRRWDEQRVALWIAGKWRKMDYERDRLSLSAEMMVSAEERNVMTQRLRRGQIKKGPLSNNGWPGATRYGIKRDRHAGKVEDRKAMKAINRAFELADSGTCFDNRGLSVSRVTDALEREGMQLSPALVRRALRDPIYATGEYSVNVRGVQVAQRFTKWENPVPLARFHRVQEMLSIRQGRTSRTPLGEFILNYVPVEHDRCAGLRRPAGYNDRALIKGYVLKGGDPSARRYRHSGWVPDCCRWQGIAWERSALEPPIIEAVRQCAEDPDVLRALAATASTEQATVANVRLTPLEREQLELDIERLKLSIDEAIDQHLLAVEDGSIGIDLRVVQRSIKAIEERIAALEQRLANDAVLAAVEPEAGSPRGVQRRRLEGFLNIMTVEVPDDPWQKALRARLFQRCVDSVRLTVAADGTTSIRISGHVVPPGARLVDASPLAATGDLIEDAFSQGTDSPDADHQIETDSSVSTDNAVSKIYADQSSMPRTHELRRQRRHSASYRGWVHYRDRLFAAGESGWTTELDGVAQLAHAA